MVARRIDMHRLQELVRLHRLETKVREIARILGMSPNTERRYRLALARAGLLDGDPGALPELGALEAAVLKDRGEPPVPSQSASSVEPWRGPIEAMQGRGAGARAIYDALRLEHEYTGSLSAVKRYCRRLMRDRGPSPEDVSIPVETEPGDVAQVDFGYVGKLYDPHEGRERKAWVFVMTLGHSRFTFAEIAFDQKVPTWVDLHIRAFHALGGVPRVVVPDNLKAAVIRAAFSNADDCSLNRTYRELARHYGFKIDPTPPRAPKKKGKVESAVKYIKNNFFKPRELSDISVARRDLAHWLRDIANVRIHGTTGRRPAEVLAEEQPHLLALPPDPYEVIEWKKATLHTDCHLLFGDRLYSAPWSLIGRELWVRASPSSVVIFDGNERVATHSRRAEGKRSTVESHLPEHRRDYRQRTRSYWEERAQSLGDEVASYIRAVFDSDDVLYQLRTVQSMVRHLEGFPKSRAQRACLRAAHFGSYKYGALKTILSKGLDMEPLPEAPSAPSLTEPRFARQPSEIVNPNLDLFEVQRGESHEYH